MEKREWLDDAREHRRNERNGLPAKKPRRGGFPAPPIGLAWLHWNNSQLRRNARPAREAGFRAIWRPHPTRIPRETRIHGSNQSRRERQGSDDRRRSRHAAALRAAQRSRPQQSAL